MAYYEEEKPEDFGFQDEATKKRLETIQNITTPEELKAMEELYFEEGLNRIDEGAIPGQSKETATTSESASDNSKETNQGNAASDKSAQSGESSKQEEGNSSAASTKETPEEKGAQTKQEEANSTDQSAKTNDTAKGNTIADENKAIVIDDEFLAKQTDEDRALLQGIKGGTLDPRTLKNYLSAQRLIQNNYKRRESILEGHQNDVNRQNNLSPFQQGKGLGSFANQNQNQNANNSNVNGANNNNNNQTQTIDNSSALDPKAQAEKVKSDMVFGLLKQRHPDLPDDPEGLKEYKTELITLDPDAFYELKREEENLKVQVAQEVDNYLWMRSTQEQAFSEALQNQLQDIKEYVSYIGLDLTKDLGIDFTPNEQGGNEFVASLLLNDKGKIKPHLVTNYHDLAYLNNGALVSEFLNSNKSRIKEALDRKHDEVSRQARKEGYIAANEKKTTQTLGSAPEKGSNQTKEIYTEDEISKITDVNELAKAEKTLLQKLKSR